MFNAFVLIGAFPYDRLRLPAIVRGQVRVRQKRSLQL
jgi:hypothetical protein